MSAAVVALYAVRLNSLLCTVGSEGFERVLKMSQSNHSQMVSELVQLGVPACELDHYMAAVLHRACSQTSSASASGASGATKGSIKSSAAPARKTTEAQSQTPKRFSASIGVASQAAPDTVDVGVDTESNYDAEMARAEQLLTAEIFARVAAEQQLESQVCARQAAEEHAIGLLRRAEEAEKELRNLKLFGGRGGRGGRA